MISGWSDLSLFVMIAYDYFAIGVIFMAQNPGNVTVRISLETQKKLDRVAAGFDRSRNWLINEAIENYLDVYDWQEKRIKERLKKAEKGGKFVSGSQVDRMVESFKP